MKAIIGELEGASHDLDTLIGDLHHERQAVRTLEAVEERVKAIASRMLVAVRGPDATIALEER